MNNVNNYLRNAEAQIAEATKAHTSRANGARNVTQGTIDLHLNLASTYATMALAAAARDA